MAVETVVTTTTAASNDLIEALWTQWHGKQVFLTRARDEAEWLGVPLCDEHNIIVMHHRTPVDEKDLEGAWVHYCPTGLIFCPPCMLMGEEPDPPECELWGEGN